MWSPGGTKIVTPWPKGATWLANELVTIDMDGNTTKLTNFNESYSFANLEDPVWSPDGQHIGFWLKVSNADNSNPSDLRQWLAVVDTSSLETQIYCMAYSIPIYPAFSIVWSPDGQQLIANIRLPNGDMQPTLVNLINQTQTIIDGTQGMRVKDWLAP
jgi:Tol biopolymer transport system component